MKIVIVADVATVESRTGIARYAHELIERLAKKSEVEVIDSASPSVPKELLNHCAVAPIEVLRRRRRADIFHALAPINALSFPFLSNPTVVMYHDLATLLYRKGSSLHVKLTASHFYKIGRYCNSVVVNSTQTRQELIQRLHFPEHKIQVISLGVDERFKPEGRDDRDYLVIGYIGHHAPRKRIDYLIKAFYHFKKAYPTVDAKLEIYGHCNPECGTLHALPRALGIASDVEFHGAVPEDMLVDAYNSFDVFVLPSDWEGFGLPILEAQRCGVPVIIRADVHIPEEVGRQCLKATTEQHMATLFHKLLEKDFRDSVVQSGLRYSRFFTWERTADETFSLYESLLENDQSS